jgi:hypothetical protein
MVAAKSKNASTNKVMLISVTRSTGLLCIGYHHLWLQFIAVNAAAECH